MSRYLTINATAKHYELPEWMLRSLLKRGELPGFYAGSRFYIDTQLLTEKLETISRANMTRSVEASA